MAFSTWIDTLVSEKNINTGMVLEVEGPSGLNMMPLEVLIEAIKSAPSVEQAGIKNTLVKIDFMNGDIVHFFEHLAKAIAI